MSELINKLNQYRSMGDKFYPEDIVVIEDIWALIDEIERLNNIIKEVREYIESYMPNYDFDKTNLIKLLQILDKGSEKE